MCNMMKWAQITILWMAVGCSSTTTLSYAARQSLSKRYHQQTVELKQSCYYGDLYDENEKWLLAPQLFINTSDIDDLHGQPIHPTHQRGIVPAGSRLILEKIEFPDTWAMAKRLLTTPRYNPWVYLHAENFSPEPSNVPNKPFVVVLPADMSQEKEVVAFMEAFFAPPKTMQKWLAARRPTIRVAIEHKQVIQDMAYDELIAAMGNPLRWFIDSRQQQQAEVAWYNQQEVWLVNDHVVDVRPGRTLPPKP